MCISREDSHSSASIIRRQVREMLCHAAGVAQACDSIQLEQHCLSGPMCLCLSCYVLAASKIKEEKRKEILLRV